MFGGRFSHTRFSLRDTTEEDVRLAADFAEAVSGMISFAQVAIVQADFREATERTVTGTRGFIFANAFMDRVGASLAGARDYPVQPGYRESVSGDIYLSSEIAVRKDFAEKISPDVHLGSDAGFGAGFSDAVDGRAYLAKNLRFDMNSAETVLNVIKAGVTDEDAFVINLNIPPGAEIRIDSEYFTATMNGANILHYYTGDWITVSRDTINMMVSAPARLTGQILYMERFL